MIDKKEAIRQYKNNLPAMGVYCVTNLASKKILIGSSTDRSGFRLPESLVRCQGSSLHYQRGDDQTPTYPEAL